MALALIAVFLVKVYLGQQRQIIETEAKKKLENIQANQTPVLVAKKDISRGSIIDPDSLEVNIIPNQYLQPQAVASLDRISGMIVIAPISKGEQITLGKLSYQQTQAGSLAMATPIGKRAITISVDNISSLAGMIKPGDYVDVIGMLSIPVQTPEGKQVTQVAVMPLFQNILILAVGQQTAATVTQDTRYKKEEQSQTTAPLITLALNPQEANLIAFVQEQGKIRLVLRSPADAQIQPITPANWDTLFQYIMPVAKPGPEEKAEEVATVEIYRGLNKEVIPLSK